MWQLSHYRVAIRQLHFAWQLVFYLVSLGLLIAISFWTVTDYQLTPAFTLDNYRDVIGKELYIRAAGESLRLGLTAAALAVTLAFPVAYTLAFHLGPRLRLLALFALLLPFFSNYVVRMLAWQVWINDRGILAWVKQKILVGNDPLGLLFTEKAVLIGLLSILVPVASVILYLSLLRLDKTLILAARNLGASRWQTFLRVEIPFALPGMFLGFLFCFIIAFGDFVCSSILGGNQIYYLSIAIEDRVRINDWPTGAVLGTLLLIVAISVVSIVYGIANRLPTTTGRSRIEGRL